MSWSEYHSKSEDLAASADSNLRKADQAEAERLYKLAADAEAAAFGALDPGKLRTRGITAVSAVSLYYKGNDYPAAQSFAFRCLASEGLPEFAITQLQGLLQTLWGEQAISAAGMTFAKQDVFVAVRGGEILTGGAPLDLILRKVEEVRAIFYRTVEFLMNRPLRLHGGPAQDIQQLFRPWLFQAPPGSYQFAVRLESPKQMELPIVPTNVPAVEEVTRKFVEIVKSAATDSEDALRAEVPDQTYRTAFLKLTRNLAPTGRSYSELEIRSATQPRADSIRLVPTARKAINDTIKRTQTTLSAGIGQGEEVHLSGILRAVHLDQDWLEITISDGAEQHIKVERAGEAIDDVVGPMINRRVKVDAIKTPAGKHLFKDIEADE